MVIGKATKWTGSRLLLIILGLVGFIIPTIILGTPNGILVGGGILVFFVIIFAITKIAKKTPDEKFSAAWWKKEMYGEKHTVGKSLIKIVFIVLISSAFFLLNTLTRWVSADISFGASIILGLILAVIFFGAPTKIFTGTAVLIGLPAGFWLLTLIKAPPIVMALFLLFYLVLFPIALPKIGWIFTILGIIGIVVLLVTAPKVQLLGAENALTEVQSGFIEIGTWFETQWEKIKKGGERVFEGTLGEGYFEGEVQEAAGKNLGVFIDEFRSISPTYREGEPILLFSQIRAETITDEPINIITECSLDGKKGTITPPHAANFLVETSAIENINCDFEGDATKFSAGNYKAKLSIGFDFTTNAFVKAYFMDQQKLREFRSQNLDPAEEFGFETNPTAVYTAGPIMIGMNLGRMPLGVQEEIGSGPNLLLTLENMWNGKIKKLKNIIITSPVGIKLDKAYPGGVMPEKCTGCEKGSQECICTYDLEKSTKDSLGKNIITLSFHTEIIDPAALIGTAPASFKTFKVSMDYDYVIEEQMGITIKRKIGGTA